MNPFLESYKSLSDEDLLDVLERHALYQPMAVEAAKVELERRQLSDEQTLEARAKNEQKRKEKFEQEQKIAALADKVKSVGGEIIETFHPVQQKPKSPDTYIKIICLTFGVIALVQFFKDLGLFKYMLADIRKGDWGGLIEVVPYIFMPIALTLFWKKKRGGWIMLTLYTVLSLVGTSFLFFDGLHRGQSPLDFIMPRMQPEVYFGILLFYIGMLLLLCRKSIREVYGIQFPQPVP